MATAPGATTEDGPEVWSTVAGAEWVYWDLWMCLICHLDCGGDFDAFDELLTAQRTSSLGSEPAPPWEQLWSHLLDLRQRLESTGLDAADLAGRAVPGTRTRARNKLFKRSLQPRDMTPPMRCTPKERLELRALNEYWPHFPVSPQEAYTRLDAQVGGTDRYWSWRSAWDLGDRLETTVTALLATASEGTAGELAVRRAGLALGYQLMECVDDSSGMFGETVRELLRQYVRCDWRATGISPDVYWRDLLYLLCTLENYGGVPGPASALLRQAGVRTDLELAEQLVRELAGDYRQARMAWHARTMLSLTAQLAVASRGIADFPDIARTLGSDDFSAINALKECALRRNSPRTALAVLRAANTPGKDQRWIRRHLTTLESEHPGL